MCSMLYCSYTNDKRVESKNKWGKIKLFPIILKWWQEAWIEALKLFLELKKFKDKNKLKRWTRNNIVDRVQLFNSNVRLTIWTKLSKLTIILEVFNQSMVERSQLIWWMKPNQMTFLLRNASNFNFKQKWINWKKSILLILITSNQMLILKK